MQIEYSGLDCPTSGWLVLIADRRGLIRHAVRSLVVNKIGQFECIEADHIGDLLPVVAGSVLPTLAFLGVSDSEDADAFFLNWGALSKKYPLLRTVVIASSDRLPQLVPIFGIRSVYSCIARDGNVAAALAAIEAALEGVRRPPKPAIAKPLRGLTARQNIILSLINEGLSNKQISIRLRIAEGTVKNHVTNIFEVLRVSNRTQAASIFQRSKVED